jgi:hypothetical protein
VSLRETFWPLLGNWTGVERLASGQSARAMIVFKLDVHDLVVTQDYRQVRDGGQEYTSHGVFMIDGESDGVLWWLFDSTGRPPNPARGSWSEGELTLRADGAEHRFAVVDDQLHYRVSSPDSEVDQLRGSYRRISAH